MVHAGKGLDAGIRAESAVVAGAFDGGRVFWRLYDGFGDCVVERVDRLSGAEGQTMSEETAGGTARRKPRLAAEQEVEKPWKVRGRDGRVWEKIGWAQLKELREAGVLLADSEIAKIGSNDWSPLGTHLLWQELGKPAPDWRFDTKAIADPGPQASQFEFAGEPTQKMKEQLARTSDREARTLRRKLWLWGLAQGLRVIRELFVFFAFLACGDLLTEGLGPALGLVKWVVAMGVIALAVAYYTLRIFGR